VTSNPALTTPDQVRLLASHCDVLYGKSGRWVSKSFVCGGI
jgi:hypothetical protein